MSKFKNRRSLISRISAIFDPSKRAILSNQKHKPPCLELLESRLVPTFNYVVTNITDVPGEVGGPLDGSLRRGLQLAGLSNEDAVITFDPTVFNSQSPQTITLNGVDGALLLSNPQIQVNGPGTSSDFTPLTIQAINGIETASVAAAGVGYTPGDILYQPVGSGPAYAGGAQFTVTSVGPNGTITGVYVQKPGGGQQVNEILDSTLFPASLINLSGNGTGAKLQVRTLRAASGLFVTQTQATSAELSGMTLANSFSEVSGSPVGAIYHIGGTLGLSNIFINGDIGNGIKGYGIYTQSGSGPLNITDSKIINVSLQGIRNDNANSITINNSLIEGNDTGGIYNYSSLNATIKITNSEFRFNGDSLSAGIGGLVGAIFTVSKLDIANSYFVNNVSGFNGGAIEMHGPSTVIKDSFFNSNITLVFEAGLTAGSQTMGGGAIWNEAGDLTITKTGFTDNQANFYGRDSGGGAVYNQSGKLTLSQSTFYGNVANIFTNPAQVPVPPDATITDPSQYPTSRYSGGGALYSGGDSTINQVTFADNRVDCGVNIWRMPNLANWGVTIPMQPMYSGGGAVYLTNSPIGGTAAVQSILTEVTFADNAVKATALPGTEDTVDFATPLDQAAIPGTIDTDVYGRGLTGGALIISDAHERANLNTNNDAYVTGKTNNVQMVNVTITNNKVDNQLLPITSANGVGLVTRADAAAMSRGISGGIFMDTAPGNTNGVQATNNLIVSNYGVNFIGGKYINNVVTDIGTQTAAFNDGAQLILKESSAFFLSNGHNYYSGVGIQLSNVSNPSAPYAGQVIGPGPGDIRDIPQNLLDPNGLAYNPGPNTVVGMTSPNIYTQNVKTDLIKTVGLTRNSPARDTGDISVFNSGLTTPYDNRYINRAVNLAIDIGAYEAQLPSLSTITSMVPNPAEYGQPVSLGVTVNSDGVNSKIGIVGTIYLENSKTLAIIASQPVTGLAPLPGQQATVSTTFNINNVAGQYFTASNIYDLRAFFDNSSDFAPSKTDIVQLTVNPAVTNIVLNSGNPNPSVVNSTVAISGIVSAPNSTASIDGAVTLYDVTDPVNPISLSSASVSSGAFSINYDFLESKVYYLQAKYSSSSGNFLQSVSNTQSQDVGLLLTNTLVVNPGTIGKGASTTLSATISSADSRQITGPVQFSYTNSSGTIVVLGVVDSASAVVDPTQANGLIYTLTVNSATANLPLGTLPIVASYIRIGIDPYVGISSAPQNLIVTGQVTTTQLSVLPLGTIIYGSLVQLTATVNPTSIVLPFGTSNVTFYDGAVALGSAPINVTTRQAVFTTISLGGGAHNLTAVYSGDGLNYQGSTSPIQPINIQSRNTTTTLSCSPATGATGAPVIMTATIVGVGSTSQMASPTGSVVFMDGSVVLGTASVNSNNQAVLSVSTLTTGTHQLSATFNPSNGNYSGSNGALVFIVKKVVAQPYYAIAPSQGPTLVGFNTSNNQQAFAVMPFGPIFKGGLRTATGDTNGDGVADIIVSAGPGGNSTIKIYDGKTLGVIATFQAYGGYNGAVNIAAGDLNNDGYADIITAPGSLGPTSNVKAFSGKNGQILRSFLAYAQGYTGGVTVAAGDVNGDGYSDIITGPQVANPPHVKVFSGQSGSTLQSFYAYSAAFNGGIFVAAGDFNGDGFADIVTGANAGGGPHVVVVSGANPKVKLGSFYAYSQSFSGGVRVGAVDINGDGIPEIITGAGAGIGPLVTRWTLPSGATNFKQVDQFYAYGKGGPNNYTAGTFPSV